MYLCYREQEAWVSPIQTGLHGSLALLSDFFFPKKKGDNVAGWQGGKREINDCYSKTKENWSWGMLSGDQRRVTSPQRLEWPMK
jgi:hypothetical protein